MSAAWVLCALCVTCGASADDEWMWPACARAGADCERGPAVPEPDEDWTTRDYVVNGKRWLVAQSGDAERWHCAGADPAAAAAPRHRRPYMARVVELIDCSISPTTFYSALLKRLLNWTTLENLTLQLTMNRSRDSRPDLPWPSDDELKQMKLKIINDPEFASGEANGVQHLVLRGTLMSSWQLASVRRVETLSLAWTGLEKVMDLSHFTQLWRLEIIEPGLMDAQQLASAPALRELVLQAPDAGLAAMPRLRNATFLDVYATHSIFGDCGSLEELALVGGLLDAVFGRWLAGCARLWRLRLTKLSRLRALPAGLLADAAALESLDLSRNALESLPPDLVAHSPCLARLDLAHNALRSLPPALLADARALDSLDVSYNHFLTLPEGFLNVAHVYACGLNVSVTVQQNNLDNLQMDDCSADLF